ncbi:MAG: hypothetical protein KIS85_03270 [Anaerolineales bacterium]|nr:hypothetical protein [Anaerolineales bacterium]
MLKRSVLLLLFLALLAACAPGAAVTDTAAAVQTAALATLQAEAAVVQAEIAEQEALAQTEAARPTLTPTPFPTAAGTSTPAELVIPTTPSPPTNTPHPTNPPGIASRFVNIITCGGTPFATILVNNVGPQTYQSAIVVLSDGAGHEIRRADGNNEFLPSSSSCPGAEAPTLGPRSEAFVVISAQGLTGGDSYLVRVTVCTERGARGECYSARADFVR